MMKEERKRKKKRKKGQKIRGQGYEIYGRKQMSAWGSTKSIRTGHLDQ
jgi:hypothetical protein